jgi:uncharacterized membrane protein
MRKSTATIAAISGLLTLGAAAFSSPALAADKPDMEKCYGVCAGPAHACAGQSKADGGAKEWLNVPKGTCERLVGGSLTVK